MSDTVRVMISILPGNNDIELPEYLTPGSAGMDIRAAMDNEICLKPGERALIPTGFTIALPATYEAQIRPRSGLAMKHGITLLNSPGTIDSDYRGEVKVILINLGEEDFIIKRNDRIAQMIVSSYSKVIWEIGENLPSSERGPGGFGHTGKN